MSEDRVEMIRIELNMASAAVLGALLVVANNELLQLDRDISGLLEILRQEGNIRFSTKLENMLGDFTGAKTDGGVTVSCEDGKVTVIKKLPEFK